MRVLGLLLGVALVHNVLSVYVLRQLSFTELPTSVNNDVYTYGGLDKGTATGCAFDHRNKVIYVIGEQSGLLHVLDVSDPSSPQLVFVHSFTSVDGAPRSIDVCGDQVAVAMAADVNTQDGQVQLFSVQTSTGNVTFQRQFKVGPSPKSVRYTSDCRRLVVTNEGVAGKDARGHYLDPQGTVSIVDDLQADKQSVITADFTHYNLGNTHYNANIRTSSLYIPLSLLSPLTTVAQDLEPDDVTISADDKTAWVSLQENNAIAVVNLTSGQVTAVHPLPRKSWAVSSIDTSDKDGGVHRRQYHGLWSLRQPGALTTLNVNNRNYVITADAGAIRSYTKASHTFTWTDAARARTLSSRVEKDEYADLQAQAANDELLGRLHVSTVDGRNHFDQQYRHLEAFGGRGFSVWSPDFSAPVFDSTGSMEQLMEERYKPVFNTDYLGASAGYMSPETMRDTVSDNMGARLTGLAALADGDITWLVAGAESTGTLYLYVVNTAWQQPVPRFESAYRAGDTDIPWNDLYASKEVGDLCIADLRIIGRNQSPNGRPLVYVASRGSGTLSLYEIYNELEPINVG